MTDYGPKQSETGSTASSPWDKIYRLACRAVLLVPAPNSPAIRRPAGGLATSSDLFTFLDAMHQEQQRVFFVQLVCGKMEDYFVPIANALAEVRGCRPIL